MSEEENTLRESTATYVTALLDRSVGEITVRQLRQIIQEVIREEQRAAVSMEAEGYLVFPIAAFTSKTSASMTKPIAICGGCS